MSDLTELLKYETLAFLFGLILVFLYKILSKQINLKKMIYNKGTTKISKVRLQKLIVAGAITLYMTLSIVKNPAVFPDVPDTLLYLMGASSAAYLGLKAQDLLKVFKKLKV